MLHFLAYILTVLFGLVELAIFHSNHPFRLWGLIIVALAWLAIVAEIDTKMEK